MIRHVKVRNDIAVGSISQEPTEWFRFKFDLVFIEVAPDVPQFLLYVRRAIVFEGYLRVIGIRDQIRDSVEILMVAQVQVGDWDVLGVWVLGIGQVRSRTGVIVETLWRASRELWRLIFRCKRRLLSSTEGGSFRRTTF